MSYTTALRKAAKPFREVARKTVGQMASCTEQNANMQAALQWMGAFENTSNLSNPYIVGEGEKYEVLESIRTRAKASVKQMSQNTILKRLTPIIIQLGTKGLNVTSLTKLLLGMKGELASIILGVGPLKTNGFKLMRLSEGIAWTCKMFTINSAALARIEAPGVFVVGMTINRESHMDMCTTDLAVLFAKDSLTRLSNLFSVESKDSYMYSLSNTKIEAVESIKLLANTSLDINSVLAAKFVSNASIKVASPLITLSDNLGATITMAGGIINLNPLLPSPPEVVIPVIPIIPPLDVSGSLREKEMLKQYEGINPHSTNVI